MLCSFSILISNRFSIFYSQFGRLWDRFGCKLGKSIFKQELSIILTRKSFPGKKQINLPLIFVIHFPQISLGPTSISKTSLDPSSMFYRGIIRSVNQEDVLITILGGVFNCMVIFFDVFETSFNIHFKCFTQFIGEYKSYVICNLI